MKNSEKVPVLFLCLGILGCSTLFYSVESTISPVIHELPSNTLEATRPLTHTPAITVSETPSPTPSTTRLPYTMVEIEKSSEKLNAILFREAQNAREIGQAPYIQIYADGCPACRALKRNMKDERMIAAYRGTYIILADVDIWQNQLAKAGIFVTGVPSIFELTFDGKPTGRFITGAAWDENTPENMAPPLDAFFHPD